MVIVLFVLGCTASDYHLSLLQFVHTFTVSRTIRYMKIVLETILIEIRTLSTYHFLGFTKLVPSDSTLMAPVHFHGPSCNRITQCAILDTLYDFILVYCEPILFIKY